MRIQAIISMYVTPSEASKYYCVSENALRNWSRDGRIAYFTTKGGHRRYAITPSSGVDDPVIDNEKRRIIYARVSSRKQGADLERQSKYLRSKYPDHTLITDTGSGINFNRTGFKRVLEGVFKGNISEVVVAHRDRFTRFGYDLFTWIFQQHNARLLVCDSEHEQHDDRSELQDDIMAIITVFAARFHGKRKYEKIRSKCIL